MGKYYECLTGLLRCVKAPDNNKYNIKKDYDYEIVDGQLKEIECNVNAIDLEELNWYFKNDEIEFEIIEKYD